MSAQDLSEALDAPDGEDFHERLSQLVNVGVDAGTSPAVAQAYLRTFSNSKVSHIKRRWTGIALCQMLQKSPGVVTHLKRSTQELTSVGDVILDKAELEETKIVAGLVIREGMARGIKFLSFWRSDKVQNSASNFPRDAGPRWMEAFQDFLETLASLQITERVIDSDLFFVVALSSSDGYKWKEPNDVAPVLLIQRQNLSVMAADPTLQDFYFVDLPLSHIHNVRRKRAVLHDSQDRQNQLKPSNVILRLKSGPWTFRVNSAEHSSNELSILFVSEDDAKQCELAIRDLLHRHSMQASSESICISRTVIGDVCGDAATRIAQQTKSALAGIGEVVTEEVRGAASTAMISKGTEPPISSSKASRTQVSLATARPQGENLLASAFIESTSPAAHNSAETEMAKVQALQRATAPHDQDPPTLEKQNHSGLKKAGGLPTVKTPAGSNGKTRQSAPEMNPCSFDFPEDPPRIKRSKRSASNAPTRPSVLASTPQPRQELRVSQVGTKAKRKLIQQETKASNGEDEHSQSPPLARRTRKASLNDGRHDTVSHENAKSQGEKGLTSNLPRISKSKMRQAPDVRQPEPKPESDVFEIPEDDKIGPKVQRRSKRKRVVYKEAETSDENNSDSDYTETNKRTTRASKSRTQAPKTTRSHKTANSVAKKTRRGSVPSTAAAEPWVSGTNSTLVSGSQVPSRPQPKPATKHVTAEISGEKEHIPDAGAVAEPLKQPNYIQTKSEMSVLNKLNEPETDDGCIAHVDHEHQPGSSLKPSKRRPDTPPPATPPHTKRVKTTCSPSGNHTKQHGSLAVMPPTTNAPLRVLADPSSPCSKQGLGLAQVVPWPATSMRAPAVPTAADGSHSTSRRSRQSLVESRKLSDRKQTPLHRLGKRVHSGSSANVELLSSNSKPTPASPSAESTAISGHVDPKHLEFESFMGEHEIATNDPFNPRSNASKLTSFTRRLTGDERPAFEDVGAAQGSSYELPIEIGDDESSSDEYSDAEAIDEAPKQHMTPSVPRKASPTLDGAPPRPKDPARRSRSRTAEYPPPSAQRGVGHALATTQTDPVGPSPLASAHVPERETTVPDPNADGPLEGATLVAHTDPSPLPPQHKPSPILLRSSPPPLDGSPSSHSSTSAEENEPRTSPPVPPSEADEVAWAAALKPHQRSLHDALLRVSTRVVQHVVDSETAVEGITDGFARDGGMLLDEHVRRCEEEGKARKEGVERKMSVVKGAAEGVLKRMYAERKEVMEG